MSEMIDGWETKAKKLEEENKDLLEINNQLEKLVNKKDKEIKTLKEKETK